MIENRIKDGNYYVVQSFMVKELGLKGLEKDIYAIIYGFSQAENQTFTGSLQYLADWTNCTKQGVLKTLNSLVEKGLIQRKENIINNVKFVEYYSTEFNGGIKLSLMGGIKQSLTNNKISNNINYKEVQDLFNEICVSLPKCTTLSDKRKKSIKARLNNHSIDDIKRVFEMAEASDFLKGKNDRNWTANFDWLLNDNNFCKVLDGNYANRKTTQSKDFVHRDYSHTDLNVLFDNLDDIKL